jgi:hypothetical protein
VALRVGNASGDNRKISPRIAAPRRCIVHRVAVAGHEILDHRQAGGPPVEAGTALQQRLGIRILRVFEDPLRRTLFKDLPSSIRRLLMTIQKSRIALLIAGAVGLLGARANMPDQTASRSYSMGFRRVPRWH